MKTVQNQSVKPYQILIIDGSQDDFTGLRFRESKIENLHYHKVPEEHRGLTRQRNYGVQRVDKEINVVAFLDDDVLLEADYFEQILNTYHEHPDALAVGGYITNEVEWNKSTDANSGFCMDGYCRSLGSRHKLRNKLGLAPDVPPGHMPAFGHGYSVSFLPPSGKTYPVQQLMGGVASYRASVFKNHIFSSYFEGYGLYEDADFSLRLARTGKLYINTAARLEHHHDPSGRPNYYKYGKMVVRNGWYVWHVVNPQPTLKAILKWYAITKLLIAIRLSNVITGPDRSAALKESIGRIAGLCSLLFNAPRP
ncbi:glycosyltransferase family A protein [Nonlabens ponticola]|nr:glycosyltransferase family 2 protein [Nonlabens ponticola]